MTREAKSTSFKEEKELMNFSKKKNHLASLAMIQQETKVSSHLSSIPVSMFRKVACTSSDLAEIQHSFIFSVYNVFQNSVKFDQCRVQILEFFMQTQNEDYPITLFDTDNPFLHYFILFLMHQKSHNNSTYLVYIILFFGYSGFRCLAFLLCSIFQISCFDKNIDKSET